MRKILLEDINEYFSSENYILMVGLGFDVRCLSVVNHLTLDRVSRIVGVCNAGWSGLNEKNTSLFRNTVGSSGLIIGDSAVTVLDVADELVAFFGEFLGGPEIPLAIDITSLSHELLVVLLGILHSMGLIKRTTLLYVGAAQYGFNTPRDPVWLSRGVDTIRSILGFPGAMLPSKKLHLMILAGFEVERASEIVVRYEPASLSIGLGKREQSVSAEHYDNNKLFFDRLNQFVEQQDVEQKEVHHFEFSCVDPFQTKNQLLAHIENLRVIDDKNIVICPLNTKLSTVGVVLAALEHPEIQICYAEPNEYNAEGYAKPGAEVTVVELANL